MWFLALYLITLMIIRFKKFIKNPYKESIKYFAWSMTGWVVLLFILEG